jgi:hypothetical protein
MHDLGQRPAGADRRRGHPKAQDQGRQIAPALQTAVLSLASASHHLHIYLFILFSLLYFKLFKFIYI